MRIVPGWIFAWKPISMVTASPFVMLEMALLSNGIGNIDLVYNLSSLHAVCFVIPHQLRESLIKTDYAMMYTIESSSLLGEYRPNHILKSFSLKLLLSRLIWAIFLIIWYRFKAMKWEKKSRTSPEAQR